MQHEGPKLDHPRDIAGRRLLVFQRAEFQVLPEFASAWLRERLFKQKPESFPIPAAPTREFCVVLFTSKIKATVESIGNMIWWEDSHNTAGPVTAAAKRSLLRLIPHVMPAGDDEDLLYHFVMDHGDFGVHNISIAMDANS
ncbi:hypothetical protein GGS23DRAFT_600182 [Durotheca rogersii]|uniref:uncharacterized protein n=1 Tax=Durotheca rogersii TaxID=419775 RepID=UPI00221EE84B|nr:uncharacterized protein GGS23DRAFT_600182 [Durotheca rogersii]KAI5859658.1 hypothetical protein GGS23DRAFT_600182 [Durotheca rogersii]